MTSNENKQTYLNIDFQMNSLFNDLSILSCTSCEFSFVSNPPSNCELKRFYELDYRSNSSPYKLNFTHRNPSPIDFRAISQISLATNFTKFIPGDIFLDLGAGSGNSFQVAKTILCEPTLVSVESSTAANRYYSKNFGVKSYSDFEEFRASGNMAKIILLSHSLEHFRFDDLTHLLTQVALLLSENGVCIIEVPAANLVKDRNYLQDDSPHLLFFSIKSIKLLLERLNFKILFAETLGSPLSKSELSGNRSRKDRFLTLLVKVLNKFQRTIDLSMLMVDVSPAGPLYSNFSQIENGSVIRVAVTMKRLV